MKLLLTTLTLFLTVACSGGVDNAVHAANPDDTVYPVEFYSGAFPPILPNDEDHKMDSRDSWMKDNCLTCHENGKNDAPITKHEGMADILVQAKCRTCHTSNP
ncbi:MAG: hypothetical protein QGH51_04490 [Planctomycetota bacterium]|jgi:hypothetical protein|nr:hypothetical protein [Planctomycetota bacterium]MDP6941269.1 hypothetical protein [Planctomycetota bacterium]